MMAGAAGVVFASLALVQATAAPCPYTDLPAATNTIWTAGPVCGADSGPPCKVNRSCAIRLDDAPPVAFGDLTLLTTNTSVTLGDLPTLDLSLAIMPPSAKSLTLRNVGQFTGLDTTKMPPNLTDMYFVNATNGAFPKGLVWPPTLDALYIFNTDHVDVRHIKLPPTATLLDFWNATTIVNLDKLHLPDSLDTIYFSNCTIQAIPPALEWPTSLQNLTLIDNQLQDLPHNLPDGLKFLSVHLNYIYNLGTGLPSSLEVLKLRDNKIKTVSNFDFSNLAYLRLIGNPVTTLSNLTFTSALHYFDCQDCEITTFNLDNASFTALDQLEPWDRNKSMPTILYRGFNFLRGVTVSNADCDALHGDIRTLWQGKSKAVVQVCVTGTPPNYTTIIVCISVGAVVLIAALTTYFCVKKRKLEKKLDTYAAASPFASQNVTNASTLDVGNSTLVGLVNDMSDLEHLRISGVELHRKLAEGAYGEVWKGSYDGTVVAVKRLLPHKSSPKDISNFLNECKLMAMFESPYIVKLYGVSWTRPMDFIAVLEFMDRGDLKSYLATYGPAQVSWTFKKKVMQSILEGLVYLHSMQIIHRDLKSRNVLLDSANGETIKITDFGVSKEDLQETMTVGVGTYRWMAPEILKEGHYSVAADIYSFGMLLSELDTHRIPYAGSRHPTTGKLLVDTAIMSMVINGTLEPTLTPACPEWVRALAARCIDHEPENRPTARQLVLELRRLQI